MVPCATHDTPLGPLKLAPVPVPSVLPAAPLPASVLVTPAGVILRIRLFPKSATYTFPAPSAANPLGPLKLAPVPVPFVFPAVPLPANVVVTPPGVIILTRLFPESPAYTFPDASTATPAGLLKLAPVPVPFVFPTVPLPACVVVTPPGVIFLIILAV